MTGRTQSAMFMGLLFILACAPAVFSQQAKPTPRPAAQGPTVEDMFLPDLTSGDPAKIAAAIGKLEDYSKPHWGNRAKNINVLLEAKLYDQTEKTCVDMILFDPATTPAVAGLQKLRSQALLENDKPKEALAAAKAYYDESALKDTADAIDLVAVCLANAFPEDASIVHRFKEQQVAWAEADAAAHPSADLGSPILAGITVDGSPFQDAITQMKLTDFRKFMAKGNLLLLSGKAKDAEAIFRRAVDLASSKQQPEAIENVARAIRAEAGCVGPANAYILKMRSGQ